MLTYYQIKLEIIHLTYRLSKLHHIINIREGNNIISVDSKTLVNIKQ